MSPTTEKEHTMNQKRRDGLDKLVSEIEQLKSDLEGFRDEEQEYKDNMPESLQNGDKGEAATAAIEYMENAITKLEEALDDIANAISG
jgi:flagellar biosynthesis chaperone FliJ